jgi:hypothetical protein
MTRKDYILLAAFARRHLTGHQADILAGILARNYPNFNRIAFDKAARPTHTEQEEQNNELYYSNPIDDDTL